MADLSIYEHNKDLLKSLLISNENEDAQQRKYIKDQLVLVYLLSLSINNRSVRYLILFIFKIIQILDNSSRENPLKLFADYSECERDHRTKNGQHRGRDSIQIDIVKY